MYKSAHQPTNRGMIKKVRPAGKPAQVTASLAGAMSAKLVR